MKFALAAGLVALAACTDPYLDTDVVLTPDGVRVHPTAGASVGGVGVTVAR